jgi:hypothetical protein
VTDKTHTTVAPKFKITLTAQQTLEVGRLSVIWGQIDHFLLQSVGILLTHDLACAVTLMGAQTTGPLVGLLSKARHRIKDAEIQRLAKQFCDDMAPLIEARNHITHGIWGAYLPGKDPKKAKPACLYVRKPVHPLFPEKVTEIADKAAAQTHVISKIWHHLSGLEMPEGHPIFYFGQHTPKPPKGTQIIPVGQPGKGHRS